ncbi:MAG: hypothetical protein ACI4AK_02025 [Lepagella sp.]
MSEAEMNSYRFGSGQEPTDEMLAQIMREVANDVKISNEQARNRYFADLQKGIKEQQEKWADRINEIKNGKY